MARLVRVIPLLGVLAIIAGIVYLVVTARYSSNRAKEVLITLFTWFTGASSVIFLLLTLYALFEHNEYVTDMNALFLATSLIGLAITRFGNRVFVKNHPNYQKRVTGKAKVIRRWPWPFNQFFKH